MELRTIPIHKSLTRPQLMMGCERFLFLMLVMVVTLIAGPSGIFVMNITNTFIGIVIFIIGRMILLHMAKIDNQMSDVFRRSVLYRSYYPAVSTASMKTKIQPKRW